MSFWRPHMLMNVARNLCLKTRNQTRLNALPAIRVVCSKPVEIHVTECANRHVWSSWTEVQNHCFVFFWGFFFFFYIRPNQEGIL